MTRASLLHVLDHLNEISDAEVRELEQLATAFPYCQTAHLLLAKAAHDRGSMLASQRLRRAATYATDRQLLRQLIEFTAPAPALATPPETEDAALASETLVVAAPAEPAQHDLEPAPLLTGSAIEPTAEVELGDAVAGPTTEVDAAPSAELEPTPIHTAPPVLVEASSSPEEPLLPVAAIEPPDLLPDTAGEEFTVSLPVANTESEGSLEIIPAEDVVGFSSEEAPETPPTLQKAATAEPEQLDGEENELGDTSAQIVEDFLPAVAPPIRPPLEAGSSQFEFGLADSLPHLTPVYELLDADTLEPESDAGKAAAVLPAYYGVDDVAYGLTAGSRMGYCLQSSDDLTLNLPSSFAPDALIMAHLAAHQPEVPARTSVDIISQFLRNKPRLKAPAVLSPLSDEQADLSVKSTRAEPDIASESLALIMVRQGKKDRAIEIYERLMVRQPEKMAYFADQIKKLKISE